MIQKPVPAQCPRPEERLHMDEDMAQTPAGQDDTTLEVDFEIGTGEIEKTVIAVVLVAVAVADSAPNAAGP